jgi:hypothetical protein
MRRAALAFVLLVVGCEGGSVSIDGAADKFRDEYCRYLARCGLVPSESACHDLNIGITFNVDDSLEAAIEAGKVKYDGEALARCYERIGSFSCDRTDENGRQLTSNDCYNAIQGTVGAGGQCALDAECKSRDCMVPDCPDACCQGTCVGDAPPPYPVKAGETCETSSDCENGTYCANSVCTALKPAGSTCIGNTECDYGLGCAGTGTMRVCKVLPKVGEACPDGTCRDDGLYCDATMTCKAVGLPGHTCMTQRDCSNYYSCDAAMQCALGPKIGEACGTGNRCSQPGAWCDSAGTMTCREPQADGAACTSNSQCASNFCDGPMAGMETCQTEPICF